MYVPSKRNIISSYDVVFDVTFSSALAYTLKPYSGAMDMRPAVSYIPCATSSKRKTGDIITFAQFEEGDLLFETCGDAGSNDENGDEYDESSIMPPLISKEE